MALLKEFEQNVEVVVKGLEKCVEVIRQQWVVDKDGCIAGLQKNAGMNVYRASCLYLTVSSPPVRQFHRILTWLIQNTPQVKVEIEEQYYNLVDGFSRIIQISDESKLFGELSDLESKSKKLAEDLRYCVEKAREEPQHLMAITIIPEYFAVTEKTLRRRTGEGKRFKNYPDADGTMRLDATVVARYYTRLTDSK